MGTGRCRIMRVLPGSAPRPGRHPRERFVCWSGRACAEVVAARPGDRFRLGTSVKEDVGPAKPGPWAENPPAGCRLAQEIVVEAWRSGELALRKPPDVRRSRTVPIHAFGE